MAVIRAPKKGDQASGTTAKKSVAKKVAAKKAAPVAKKAATKKVAAKKAPAKKAVAKKVSSGPHRFPTKAEIEALRLQREEEERIKAERKAAHRFPTKAELEARKAAEEALKNPPKVEPVIVSAPVITKIDGEEVELEEIELEDLDTLVEEVKEIVAEEEEKAEIRVVNVAEESQN